MEKEYPELTIEVYAPDKTVKRKGFAVILPEVSGIREIRGLHTPGIGMLDFGEMQFFKDEDTKKPEIFALHYGFFKVFNDVLTVNVHAMETVEEINVERARKAKRRAEDRLHRKKDPEEGELDVKRARLALQRALNRIALWEQYKNS